MLRPTRLALVLSALALLGVLARPSRAEARVGLAESERELRYGTGTIRWHHGDGCEPGIECFFLEGAGQFRVVSVPSEGAAPEILAQGLDGAWHVVDLGSGRALADAPDRAAALALWSSRGHTAPRLVEAAGSLAPLRETPRSFAVNVAWRSMLFALWAWPLVLLAGVLGARASYRSLFRVPARRGAGKALAALAWLAFSLVAPPVVYLALVALLYAVG